MAFHALACAMPALCVYVHSFSQAPHAGTLAACRSYVGHLPYPQCSEDVYPSDRRPAVGEGTIDPSSQHRRCQIRDKETPFIAAALKWL